MYRHSFTAFDSYCQQVSLGFFLYFLLCFRLCHLVVFRQDLSSKNPSEALAGIPEYPQKCHEVAAVDAEA